MPRILIVEDEALPRGELKRALTRQGFEVREAGNSSEAVLAAQSREIDVVRRDRT